VLAVNRREPDEGYQPAEGAFGRESHRSSMGRWRKRPWSAGIDVCAFSARRARTVTRRQTPAPAPPRGVENTRCGRWVPLAEVSSASLKRRARRRHRPCRHGAAGCRGHGCSSLTMWVASVGRTRPGSPLEAVQPEKGCGGRSQLEESRGTFDLGAAERNERKARETVHLAWTTGRTESGREGTLRRLSSTTEGASDRT
jgi:hypothetical protein